MSCVHNVLTTFLLKTIPKNGIIKGFEQQKLPRAISLKDYIHLYVQGPICVWRKIKQMSICLENY